MLIDEDSAVYPSLRTAKFVEVACSGGERSILVDVSRSVGDDLLLRREEGEADVQRVHRQSDNILNGVVKPFTRSKRITPKDGELVREVAGSDFEREVMQSENDVVIQFYSNVCDHCKKMSKRFEKVAAALQDDPSLTFLRYSVNENDIDVEQIYVGMEGGDEG